MQFCAATASAGHADGSSSVSVDFNVECPSGPEFLNCTERARCKNLPEAQSDLNCFYKLVHTGRSLKRLGGSERTGQFSSWQLRFGITMMHADQ